MNKLTLLLLFLTFLCNAQKKKSSASHKKFPLSFDLYYGNTIYKDNFYNQLNTSQPFSYNQPGAVVGIGYSNYDFAFNPNNNISHQSAVMYILPSNITINDTIHSQMSGFIYSFGLGKNWTRNVNNFKLNSYLGFNAGRSILSKQDNLNAKNPFFAPKLLVQAKIIISRFCFALLFDYTYDVSNKNWKKMGGSSEYPLEGFNQSHYSLIGSIGFCPYY